MKFSDLKGKSKEELEEMLTERLDNLLYGYKLIYRGTPEEELKEQMQLIEQEIDIIERKLKKR